MTEILTNDSITRISGDLTVQTVNTVINDVPQFSLPNHMIELEKISKIDSAGLALLVHWYNQAETSSTKLTFSNPPRKLLEIANLGGLGNLFDA